MTARPTARRWRATLEVAIRGATVAALRGKPPLPAPAS